MKEKIKALVDEMAANYEAQVKKAHDDAQATGDAREAGLKRREDSLNGNLKQSADKLAAANARAKDAEERLAKERAAHKETKDKLTEARKEIEILRPLVKNKPEPKEKSA